LVSQWLLVSYTYGRSKFHTSLQFILFAIVAAANEVVQQIVYCLKHRKYFKNWLITNYNN
jgi:hypothetical protein